MQKMFLKGFGCFIVFLCCSFIVDAKAQDNFDAQKKDADTSIATPEMVIAVAVSSPAVPIEAANTGETATESAVNQSVALTTRSVQAVKQELFKQLHPLSISFVQAYHKRNEQRLERIHTKFTRQFTMIDNVMLKYELPLHLKYLAVIESELSNKAVSNKGAVGPWQFMAPTGRLMGLTINKHRDERRDLSKSTVAAAKYLKVLYNQFNDWLLVIAAYNCGASRVEYAIKKSNSRDFWKLQYHLPAESRAHVKKFIAARYFFDCKAAESSFNLLNIAKLSQDEIDNAAEIHITGKYRSAVVAKMLGMDQPVFDNYNPGFDKEVAVDGYSLRLPKDKMEQFNAKRQEILSESVQALLNENTSIISAENKEEYPEAIQLSKPKAATIGDDGRVRKKAM
ncbi:MAG: lytic transglycosylase domain-containing protein [Chitinophagaceae bacterium]|nr:lytic transglycosylase domain-containing protein [Chitinophagaceae bacterium]